MKVTVEFFGALTRLAPAASATLELPGGATVADALAALARQLPQLAPELDRCACARGDELVLRTQPLTPGARLALLPPVAGG